MSNQPKPTTGEWTVDDITKICDEFPTFWQSALATRINAALAAARERHGDEMTSVQLQLNKQLAAERSKKL